MISTSWWHNCKRLPYRRYKSIPDLPKALNDIIMTSLEKDPAKRFQSAEEFNAALGSITARLESTLTQTTVSPALGGIPHVPNATPMQAPAGATLGSIPQVVKPTPMPAPAQLETPRSGSGTLIKLGVPLGVGAVLITVLAYLSKSYPFGIQEFPA